MKKHTKIAVIDLGTNSIRCDVYTSSNTVSFQRTYRKKSMVRLGENVFKSGQLSSPAMSRASEAIKEFSEVLKEQNIERTVAFSTCALRESNNARDFVDQVEAKTGIRLQIISGKEEARLISKGILSNEKDLPLEEAFGLVDIGGGSTEVSLCYKRAVLAQDSLPLGSSRLTQVFGAKLPLSSKPLSQMNNYIQDQFHKVFSSESWNSTTTLICSSGTAKAFFKIARAKGFSTNPLYINDLSKIISDIKNKNENELLAYPGMESKRVDIIVAGGILLQKISTLTGAQKIYLTEFNLRDGIIEEQIENLLKHKLGLQKKLDSSLVEHH